MPKKKLEVDLSPASKLAYSIEEAAPISGLSRSMLYRYIASGELETVTQGDRRLITAKSLEKFLSASHASPPRKKTRLPEAKRIRS